MSHTHSRYYFFQCDKTETLKEVKLIVSMGTWGINGDGKNKENKK